MAAPGAPTNLALTDPTTDGWTARWAPPSYPGSPPVSLYRVQLNTTASESGASEGTQVPVGAGLQSRVLTGRNPGRRYYFRVRAENTDPGPSGQGPWTAWASIGTVPVTPGTPGGVVNPGAPQHLTWGWSDPNGNDIQSYDLQWNTQSNVSGASTISVGSSPQTVGPLVPAQRYYARVRATGSSGQSGWSAWSAAAYTYPVAPSSVAGAALSTSSVRATWMQGQNGNSVTRYEIEFNGSIVTVAGSASSRDFTGLSAGSSNSFRVRAVTQVGAAVLNGPWSAFVSVSTLPGTPAAPVYSAVGTNQFTAAWTPVGSVSGNQLQVNTSASESGATTYDVAGNSRVVTGRTAAQVYYTRVRSQNASGWGAWSAWSSVATLPVAPSAPTYSALGTSSLTATWTKASNGNSVLEYAIQYNYSASESGATTVTNGTSLTRNLTGRNSARATYARVRARSASGWGAWSAWTSGTTLPVVPGSPALGSATITSLVMSYTAGANYAAGIVEYQIQHNSSASETGATTVSNGTALSRTLTGLTPSTTRYARVRARSASGWGAWTAWVSGTTLGTPAPGLSVSPSISGTQATVSLSPPSGVTTVTKYRVEYRRGAAGAVTTFETTSTSSVRTGLTPGAGYQWRASAFIGTYQSPWTAWLNVSQPSPTWLPGDFLAGSLAAGLDVTYAWTGTANGSTSTVTGKGVLGWSLGQAAGGGLAVGPQRVTGGRFGAYGARAIVTRDKTGPGMVLGMSAAYTASVSSGGIYAGSIYVRPSRPQELYPEMLFYDSGGIEVTPRSTGISLSVTDTAGWTRLALTGQAPVGAVTAIVRARDGLANNPGPGIHSNWLAGEFLDADGAMITVGALYPYFDGSFIDTAEYDYSWLGTAHQSESQRVTLAQSSIDPLQDPDCPPIPLPPSPPPIAAECVDEVGTWRRYWSILPASEISRWLAIIPTFTLTTTAAVGQVRIRVYENPDNLLPGDLNVNDYISEQLVTFIPANTEMVIDGVSERARASVNGGAWLPADHLLQGTNGGPATWPEFSCGQGYIISYDVPLEQPDGNMTPSIELTGRY